MMTEVAHTPQTPERPPTTGEGVLPERGATDRSLPDRSQADRGLVGRVLSVFQRRDPVAEAEGYGLALSQATPAERAGIVDRLCELSAATGSEAPLVQLAGVWEELEGPVRERVLGVGQGNWGVALLRAADLPSPAARRSVALLIGRTCDPDAVGRLCNLLGDSDERVAEAAGQALLNVCRRLDETPALDERTRRAVLEVIGKSAATFDKHRRREAMTAVLMVVHSPVSARAGSAVLEGWATDPDHPAQMALRAALKRGEATRGAQGRITALYWLRHDEARHAAAERLGQAAEPGEMDAMLARAHLLANQTRARALRECVPIIRAAKPSSGVPGAGFEVDELTLDNLSDASAAMAVRWVEACAGAGRAARVRLGETLEPMLADRRAAVRVQMLRTLDRASGGAAGLGGGAGNDLLLDAAFDPDARVSRGACARVLNAVRCKTLKPAEVAKAACGLVRADGKARARWGRALSARTDAWADVDVSQEPSLAAVWMKRIAEDERGATAALQAAVRTPGPEAERAMRLALRLGLSSRLELDLLWVVAKSMETGGDEQERTERARRAATAVLLLARCDTRAAQLAVRGCLVHTEGRVRANALEALTRRARATGELADPRFVGSQTLVELKADEHHRVRAGAAKAALMAMLSGSAEAQREVKPEMMKAELEPLLGDVRLMHRIAGLWLAERLTPGLGATGADWLAGRVAVMVRGDQDEGVKTRARRCAAGLLARLSSGMGV